MRGRAEQNLGGGASGSLKSLSTCVHRPLQQYLQLLRIPEASQLVGSNDCEVLEDVAPAVKPNARTTRGRKERTGGSTVPKIFFNATLIGGLVELNALRRSGGGDLEDKLKELLGRKCPEGDSAVPVPPVYGADDEAEEEQTDKMIGIVRILKQRLPIQDRLIRMRLVSNSYTASDLVEILQKHLGCRRLLAIEIGKDLARKQFIHPVFGDHKFEYGNHVYRFLDHEPYNFKMLQLQRIH